MNKKIAIVLASILVLVCLVSSISAISKSGDKKKPKEDVTTTTISATTTTTTTASTTEAFVRSDIKEGDKLVALTFDDGPYAPVTNDILDVLEKNGAVATFYVVGNRVDSYHECVERGNKLGCEYGCHTFSHINLTHLSPDQMKIEVSKTNDVIKKYTGKPVYNVRPPEGGVNDSVKESVDYPLVLWSVDSLDWKNRNADRDYHEVVDYVNDGSIVLMHDLYPATAEAVAKIVPELKAEGYKFVTVSELMKYRNVDFTSGYTYSSAKPTPVEENTSAEAE